MSSFHEILKNMTFMLALTMVMVSISAPAAVVPESVQTVKLRAGWNLVTLTKPLESMPSNVSKFLKLNPIRIDDNMRSYVVCTPEDIKAGIGYWVFSETKQTLELALDVTNTSFQPTLKQGWNLVGMTEGATWSSVASDIWAWQNGCFKRIEKKDLQTGLAYWALLP